MIENHVKEERRGKNEGRPDVHVLRITHSMIQDLHSEMHSLKQKPSKPNLKKSGALSGWASG